MDYRVKITENFWVEMLSIDACYNHGSNIVGLVDGLPNFPFTASEVKRNY